MNFSNWLIVVPARLKSERLPRKPLADLAGKPLLVRVYENLLPLAGLGARIVAAVDHDDTARACDAHKIARVMTDESHQSGTDRCAEVARSESSFKFILNVQGDEPFVSLDDLKSLMTAMEASTHPMGTLGFRRHDRDAYLDPNIVKIVMTGNRTAIYFSRAPVPFDREYIRSAKADLSFIQHQGVYAFRREALIDFCALPPSDLETTEKLEQLRAVEAGWKIYVADARHPAS